MTVTKCDRCGKDIHDDLCYLNAYPYQGSCKYVYPKLKIAYDDVRFDSDYVEEIEKEVDLCEDCQKEVRDFIFGKKEEVAHEGEKM